MQSTGAFLIDGTDTGTRLLLVDWC